MLCAFFPFCPAPMTHTDTDDDTPTPIHEPRLWSDDRWAAHLIKDGDDDGWAASMTPHGSAAPAPVCASTVWRYP